MKGAKLTTVSPTLFVMLGVPGSGRTYTARHLSQSVDGFHLQSDEWREELFDKPERFTSQDGVVERVTSLLLQKIMDLRLNVVIDGDNNRRAIRQRFRTLARKNGYEIVTIWVQTDVDSAFGRAAKRDRRITEEKFAIEYDDDMYDQELARFQSPQYEKYVVVSGKHIYKTQFYAIRKKLRDLELLKPAENVFTSAQIKHSSKRQLHQRRRLSL